ncbi:hypothetical protein LF41_692 [Lysobacter dokdonensis DS-58]|uniref:Uncharacterized protein n=1 Tax=Lysobacter dokdonensis DS-58 TaxID=1300345 RepID=A0A0A2WIZ7_9GAMM|nr:hypothetical protein [Lysobacter dokdonensis]KGQ18662.1 hypothetical protein LF41_692 [Lysobacter dokdonensis DS-58]
MYEIDHGGEFKAYRGPDRRKNAERRKTGDRREMIRFEPDKEDRRSGKDRRKAAAWGTIASRT